ncbi:MAG: 50S ribosomal protein L35 [Burkholderiales bacterium]|nr:50S ribosomal protein L35 [Phycisphaerae bacterium]
MGYKYKPNKGCVKRFKLTATGKVKRRGTMSTHLRSRRDAAMKRRLGRPAILAEGHARNIRAYMGAIKTRPNRIAHEKKLAAKAAKAA